MTQTVKFQSIVDYTPEIHGAIKGKIESVDTLPEKAGGRRVITLNAGNARYRVFESFDLKPVFDAAVIGDMLELELVKVKAIKGGKTLKQYNARLYSE